MEKRMLFHSIEYKEYLGEPTEWILRDASFGVINLIVGRNSSGKSRTLSIISGFANLLRGNLAFLFERCIFSIVFSLDDDRYHYEIEFGDRIVLRETLKKGSVLLLERNTDSSGKIYAEEIEQYLSMKVPPNKLAIILKRDEVQHSFLEPIHNWAGSLHFYKFGSDFGQNVLYAYSGEEITASNNTNSNASGFAQEYQETTKLYCSAFSEFGEEFDKSLVKDFSAVGFECDDIGADAIKGLIIPQGVPIGLYVQEKNLASKTTQMSMSTGMFRTLALIIHLNAAIFRKKPCCIVVDDIGEGLDYERSTALIALMISRCHENHFQLFMSSNDRFVMNEVDLKHWHIADRTENVVEMISYRNRREVFEDFKFLGMNNFDFFAHKAYKGDVQ